MWWWWILFHFISFFLSYLINPWNETFLILTPWFTYSWRLHQYNEDDFSVWIWLLSAIGKLLISEQRKSVSWQLLFVYLYICIHAASKLVRNPKLKLKVVFIVLIHTTATVFYQTYIMFKYLYINIFIINIFKSNSSCLQDKTICSSIKRKNYLF